VSAVALFNVETLSLETLWYAVSRTAERITLEMLPQYTASLPPEAYQMVTQALMVGPQPGLARARLLLLLLPGCPARVEATAKQPR
jgi:hypothetical protein